MKKNLLCTLIIAVLAGLLVASPVFAKADRTAIAGTEHVYFREAGSVWIANGWIQQRDISFTGTFDFGTLKGTETQLLNAKLNPATGDGHVCGNVTYTDTATGITCSGTRDGQLTNLLITAKIVATCSDGSILKGTLQDTLLNFPPGAPAPSDVYSDFDGVLLSPE